VTPLQNLEYSHPKKHRRYKHEILGAARAQQNEGRARVYPRNSPADAERKGAWNQPFIDDARSGGGSSGVNAFQSINILKPPSYPTLYRVLRPFFHLPL
jgi:hypothetical protein